MTELCGLSLAPVTHMIGFLRCDVARAAAAFCDWQKTIQEKRGVGLVQSEAGGDPESAIRRLLPLTNVERRRYLFLPTRSDWTAFLDNGHQGTDVFAPLSFLAKRLSCEAVRAVYVPEGKTARHPAVMFELYGAADAEFLNYVRSIAVAHDGRKWSFAAAGAVQDFEDENRYLREKIQERFTRDMLEEYLKALGIEAFDPAFYLPAGKKAVLIEKTGPIAAGAHEFQLDENKR